MLIDMKVFYKGIVFYLMGFFRHVQITHISFQSLSDILRKKSGMK